MKNIYKILYIILVSIIMIVGGGIVAFMIYKLFDKLDIIGIAVIFITCIALSILIRDREKRE